MLLVQTGLIFKNVLINFSVCMRLNSRDKRRKLNGKLLYVHIGERRLVEFSITIMTFSTPHSISSYTFYGFNCSQQCQWRYTFMNTFMQDEIQLIFDRAPSRISLFKNEKSFRTTHCQVLFVLVRHTLLTKALRPLLWTAIMPKINHRNSVFRNNTN